MTPFIEAAMRELPTGLSLHYPLLHAAIVGLGARRTLEFGAGGSTRIFLDALPPDGVHTSISMEARADILSRYGAAALTRVQVERLAAGQELLPVAEWTHHCGKSETFRDLVGVGPLDLILHDGSHAADVVAADLSWAWPLLKRYGLLLVHDSQHSYCGAEVRSGIARGLAAAEARYSLTTLPYGFGLTIIRREEGGPGVIEPAPAKVGSPHTTEPTELPL